MPVQDEPTALEFAAFLTTPKPERAAPFGSLEEATAKIEEAPRVQEA